MSVISFLVYFDKKVHKNWKKKLSKQKKNPTLNFAESNAHRKTNARGSFETQDLFFLALACVYLPFEKNGSRIQHNGKRISM